MALTKDDIIVKLKDAGVPFDIYEHPPVMTVEAQVNALPGNPNTVLKNLFLKDKKHRCYIITALANTKIDLQVLSARLGVGKSGTRMAPEELVTSVLQVPLGSVTPLAVANPEAANVVLLLDAKILDHEHVSADGGVVYVHPLVNTASLALTPGALAAAIRALGREPVFVDLEADPKIDRDNPPDLKALADASGATRGCWRCRTGAGVGCGSGTSPQARASGSCEGGQEGQGWKRHRPTRRCQGRSHHCLPHRSRTPGG
ncbi:hypothetical protein Vretimale_3978 [Volvox reticuliferus]|uniref:YbaK/aminoacyl-tRNA synthetase-associated domain-containing protein n=1 Tax=Volvox reticuliferus TaxID=1737510 RepID=A0A8J4G4X4_9CHLO|nr:hypothetical protein Vretimale_3978 [Volvox reticuliferus]